MASRGKLLCAELFDDPARAAYYVASSARSSWLVYDFLPWLHPEWFPAGPANRLMPFLHALRTVPRLAFISAATARDCAERILRRPPAGPVIPLGADGLGLARQRFSPAKRDVVMLGTIEARKNAAAAIRAFEMLWREGAELRLVLIGAVEQDALEEQALLRRLAHEDRLVQRGPLPDEEVRDALRAAVALLFPSEGEGYGLPPIEALAAGIPVIVSAALPALDGLPDAGQIRLAGRRRRGDRGRRAVAAGRGDDAAALGRGGRLHAADLARLRARGRGLDGRPAQLSRSSVMVSKACSMTSRILRSSAGPLCCEASCSSSARSAASSARSAATSWRACPTSAWSGPVRNVRIRQASGRTSGRTRP